MPRGLSIRNRLGLLPALSQSHVHGEGAFLWRLREELVRGHLLRLAVRDGVTTAYEVVNALASIQLALELEDPDHARTLKACEHADTCFASTWLVYET